MTEHHDDFHNLPIPYQSLDEDGIIREVNPKWLEVLGYEYDEVVGRRFSEFLTDEFKSIFPFRFEKFKNDGSVSGVEFMMIHKDGHIVSVHFEGKIVRTEKGLHTQCVLSDTTREKSFENHYYQLFNISKFGVVIYKPYNDGEDFIFVDVNPSVERIEKTSRVSLIGKKVTEAFPVVKDLSIFQGFQEVYKTGITKEIPVVLYQDDIRIGYRSNTISKLPNGNLLVVYSDETELEFSKRLLGTTLDTINTIICITIGGEHLYYCNDYFLKTFGYKNIEEFKKDHECICEYFIEDKEHGYIGRNPDGMNWAEYALRHNHDTLLKTRMKIQGQDRIYSIHVEKFLFDKKDRYFVVLDDITLLEEYQLTLKEEIERQTKKINHLYHLMSLSEVITKHGVIESDISDNSEIWTDGIYQIIEDDEKITPATSQNRMSFIHEEDIEQVKKSLEDSIQSGEFEVLNYRIITMKENLKYIRGFGHFVNVSENNKKMVLVLQDVTQEKLFEQLNEENKKLLIRQHHLNSLKQMFTNIAHHWRQPLNAIMLSSENLRDYFEQNTLTKEVLDEYVKMIGTECQYLSRTINRFSEISEDSQDKTSLNLKEIVLSILELLKPKIASQNISVETNLSDIVLISIPNELSRVIYALIENSIESITNRKEKEPEAQGKIEISLSENHGFAKVSIKDNGIGIDDELKEKIFEPYFTTKFQSRGTGLSLSFARDVISTLHRGEITVNNHIGQGVEFILEFPLSEE